jgi:Recombination endonuclease VII
MKLDKLNQVGDIKDTYNGKPCNKCGQTLRRSSNRHCIQCDRKTSKQWRKDNIGKRLEYERNYNKENTHNKFLINIYSKYQITWEMYVNIQTLQNNVCAICLNSCSVWERLSIDHNHKTGLNRGLLCHKCNIRWIRWIDRDDWERVMLECGKLEDGSTVLERIQEYNKNPPIQKLYPDSRVSTN